VSGDARNPVLQDGLIERLRDGEVSSLELTRAYLERIEAYDGQLRSYVTVCGERALEQASAADAELERGEETGPLHGLPVALKDNIDTAGVRTTMGSRFFADNVPSEDAEVARRLREAGAVLLGKTQLHEFAFGATTQNPHHGCCRNPWDPDRVPGGSSGGSGAALAADLAAAALGTDTGGSVRIPGALNGVSALRPTTGGISIRGVFPITWSFDTVGPMARSVADVGRLFAVLEGFDPGDPSSERRPAEAESGGSDVGIDGVRVGLVTGFFEDGVDGELVACVREAAQTLAQLGAAVEEIELPGAGEAFEAANQIIRAEAYAIHRERLSSEPDLFGEDVRRRLLLGEPITGAEYAAHRQAGRVWRRTVETAFERVDAVLTPATGTVAPLVADSETIETTRRLARLTYGISLAGLPALAIPCGASREGLPIGLQLAAPPWRESILLRLGLAYQDATAWHRRRPELAAASPASATELTS
jgi:aspartyl-tRNA(Asn)/glutamyl-tRNA(Gln) amidotransferase subunit A